jgi:two-component system OmpR family response regulator
MDFVMHRWFSDPFSKATAVVEPPAAGQAKPLQASQLRVLVADDDPGSCRFLCDGLHSMGASTEACSNGLAALERAQVQSFDLLLLDCRMPGAGALEIVTALRESSDALSADTTAVATTAELAPADRLALLGAGVSEILLKPCGLSDLQRVLALADRSGIALLDDGAALMTTGDATTMRALRLLLREELAMLARELDQLSQDRIEFGERLHRLRSSCGFCGAATLSTQTVLLQRQLARAEGAPVSLLRFRRALMATIQALDR